MTQSGPAEVDRRLSTGSASGISAAAAARMDKPGGLPPAASTSPARRVLHAPSAPVPSSAPPADASPSSSAPGVLHQWEGYLQKRSDWLKHWETYYFVLRGRSLYCYLSEEDYRRQPEKSKIKKGKFGFADRVTLTRVWDVEEAVASSSSSALGPAPPSAVAAAVLSGGAATPPQSAGSATASASADAPSSAGPPSAAPPPASAFRFTLETDKGHQLHFRTNSEASKHVWLQFAAHGIADASSSALLSSLSLGPDGPSSSASSSSVPPLLPLLEAPITDFYRGYEYFYAALSDRVTADLTSAYSGMSAAATSAPDGGLALSPGVADAPDRGSLGPSASASSKKPTTTFRAVVPGQPLARTRVATPADHALARFLSLLSADVILRSNYLPMVPFEGTFRGFAGVLEYFTRLSQSVCFEQFVVERVEEERDEDEDDAAARRRRRRTSRVLVVSGRETMQVRFNQTAFVQQWTHKLHVKRVGGGGADGPPLRVTRWEIFGDVVASSVVFKAPGSVTSLVLPSLSERIRESFVGGHIVSITLFNVADVRPKDARADVRPSFHCGCCSVSRDAGTDDQVVVVVVLVAVLCALLAGHERVRRRVAHGGAVARRGARGGGGARGGRGRGRDAHVRVQPGAAPAVRPPVARRQHDPADRVLP